MAKIKNPNTKKLPDLNWHISPSIDAEKYRALSFDTRVAIARKKLPWFNPPYDKSAEGEFNDEWWERILNGCPKWSDERSVALYVSLFPERTKKDYKDEYKPNPVDFYVEVTRDNARDWYLQLPEHLRRAVDAELARRPNGADAKQDWIYERVFGVWGDRPELPEEPKDAIDGLGIDEFFRMEVWREWVRMYDDIQLVETVVEMAPGIQKERRMLSEALGLSDAGNGLPDQSQDLSDTQAATIRWIQQTGETPLEFLAATYRSDEMKAGDRISAARALLDYVHRKVPVKQEIETEDKTPPKLDPKSLRGLSTKELEVLEKLLAKMVSGEK